MMEVWHAQEGRGWDGLVYLLLALAWLLSQVFSALTKKPGRKGPRPASPGPSPGKTAGRRDGSERNRSREIPAPSSGSESGPHTLREFLEQLSGPPPAPRPAPVRPRPAPPSPPSFETVASKEASRRRREARFRGPEPTIPEAKNTVKGDRADVFSQTTVSVGAVPAMREIAWVQTRLAPARGTFPAAGHRGMAARKIVAGRVTRGRIREALVWKMFLDSPRALVPPGGDVIGLNPER